MRAIDEAFRPRPWVAVAALWLVFGRAWGAAACPEQTSGPITRAGSADRASLSSAPAASPPGPQCAKAVKTATTTKVSAAPTAVAMAVPAAETSWTSTLDPLNAGGWTLIAGGPSENPSALYVSSHNVLHNGNVVTAWMRWEYSRPQGEVYPLHYLSAVTHEELDCDGRSYRRAAVIYYMRNNLREKGPSFTELDDDTTWKLAIPGSEADAMLNWGCTAPPPPASHHAPPVPKEKAAPHAAASSAPTSSAPSGGLDLHTVR
jgi:hypothetical protein